LNQKGKELLKAKIKTIPYLFLGGGFWIVKQLDRESRCSILKNLSIDRVARLDTPGLLDNVIII
jgi:hypothetical protein